MKILYLNPTGAWGGAERVLLSVMTGVRRANPEARAHLIALSDGPLVDRAAHAGFESAFVTLPDSLASLGDSQLNRRGSRFGTVISMVGQTLVAGSAAWKFMGGLRQKIRGIDPDLIHSNGIKTHCLAGFVSARKTPIVWHVHDFLSARPMASRLLRIASHRLSCAVAISQAVAADMKRIGLNPIEVVPNVVDVNDFSPAALDGRSLDCLAGLRPAEPSCLRVGLIATYARWKGQDVFLNAAAEVMRSNPGRPVRFFVIGGPIYKTRGSQFNASELRSMACQLNVEQSVGFVPFQSDVAPVFRALDIVVHASTAPEPFGLTIIEAMACAKPVIATFAGGVVDIIRPGRDGLGVPPGDVSAMAAAIQTLLVDSALRDRLGANARETVCQRFNQDRLGQQVLDVYESLLKLRRKKNRQESRTEVVS